MKINSIRFYTWPVFCTKAIRHPLNQIMHQVIDGSMPKKPYIFVIGKPENDAIISLPFTRIRLVLIFLLLMGSLISIAYFLTRSIYGLQTRYHLSQLKSENDLLKESIISIGDKIENLQSTLNTLQERNKQIRITAGLSLPDVSYGVGGPVSYSTTSLIEPLELRQTELNIEALEAGVQHLLYNTAELEEVISSKILEISHFPSIKPVKGGWISSYFGKRIDPFTGSTEDHPGIDISIKPESEVFASAAGVVTAVNNKVIKNVGYGKYILIDHGYGYQTLYGHLSKIYVKEGQQVKRWDLIALTGSTGKSTAPHLHYGVLINDEPKNPSNFILN